MLDNLGCVSVMTTWLLAMRDTHGTVPRLFVDLHGQGSRYGRSAIGCLGHRVARAADAIVQGLPARREGEAVPIVGGGAGRHVGHVTTIRVRE